MNNVYKAFTALSVGLALFACKKDEYVPAEQEPIQTYVGADITAPRDIDADGSDLMVPFTRNKVAEPLDITVSLQDASGIFTLKNAALHYEVGQATAYAAVSYSYDALVPETVYNIAVELASTEYASQYRPVVFPIAAKKAWQKIDAQFYDNWFLGKVVDKVLLKSPDGSETYRLMNPYTKEDLANADPADGDITFEYTGGLEYIEFSVAEDGSISWGGKNAVINLPMKGYGMTLHFLHPSKRSDAASVAKNKMLMDGVAQFVWYPVLGYTGSSFSWWGTTSAALISWGGLDLNDLLAN